jgi:CRP-like cAMP-binding protein
MANTVLALTEGLPERRLAGGETLYVEGESSTTAVVLVEGELLIEAGGMTVNRHAVPGTFVGEIGALLGRGRTATVTAAVPTVVREIADLDELVTSTPGLGVELARQLAGRLDRLTAYIVDVQHQVGDRDDHLGMFAELLGRIAARPAVDIDPGSDRSPDY